MDGDCFNEEKHKVHKLQCRHCGSYEMYPDLTGDYRDAEDHEGKPYLCCRCRSKSDNTTERQRVCMQEMSGERSALHVENLTDKGRSIWFNDEIALLRSHNAALLATNVLFAQSIEELKSELAEAAKKLELVTAENAKLKSLAETCDYLHELWERDR